MNKITERVEYIIDKGEEGQDVYIGRSVNYKVVGAAENLDELKEKMSAMINTWLEIGAETMQNEEPLELKEITLEEWESEYKEWMKTSQWIHIADKLYDALRDLVGDKWTNEATQQYEKYTTRKIIKDKFTS